MKILFQTRYLDSGLFMTLASLAPYLLIFLVLYLMMIRPQIKQQKALTEMLENLKKGDKVITKGGVVGKIVNQSNQLGFIKFGSRADIFLPLDFKPEVKLKQKTTAGVTVLGKLY